VLNKDTYVNVFNKVRGGVSMKIKPLEDRVVVKPASPDEKVQGGIIIPDTAKEKPQKGEIVAVGPGKVSDSGDKIPVNVKVGDTVLYGKYSGTEVTIDGEDYLIVRESDVLAII
jgi:chaperonin GroES